MTANLSAVWIVLVLGAQCARSQCDEKARIVCEMLCKSRQVRVHNQIQGNKVVGYDTVMTVVVVVDDVVDVW